MAFFLYIYLVKDKMRESLTEREKKREGGREHWYLFLFFFSFFEYVFTYLVVLVPSCIMQDFLFWHMGSIVLA